MSTIATLHPDQAIDRQLERARALQGRKRREAEERIITQCMPLASSIARRYAGRGLATEDLEQVAFLGLIKAVRGYDPRKGTEFFSYAAPTIRGEVQRHFRDAGWTVRPPRRIQELQARIAGAEADLSHRLQHPPTIAELAEALGAPVKDVTEALAAAGCFTPTSLDAPSLHGETGELGDRLGHDEDGFASSEARVMLGKALRGLAPRDRRIVALRFFEGKTQQEIGQEIGVTQMQISRLLTRILADLRASISAPLAAA